MSEKQRKRTYWWGDDKDEKFDDEAALKTAHGEACEAGKHKWESTFSFAIYHCSACKAYHERF